MMPPSKLCSLLQGSVRCLTAPCSAWDIGLEVNDDELPENAWTRALTLVLESEELSDDERSLLKKGTLKSFTEDLINLEARHAKGSHTRRFIAKIHLKPLLDGLLNLQGAVSSLTNSNSVASMVWGGIAIVCKVAPDLFYNHLGMLTIFLQVLQATLEVPEALVEFLNRIGWTLSRLQLYEKLSFKAPRLNRVLVHILAKYLALCLYLRDSFVKDGSLRRRWKTNLKFGVEGFKGAMMEKISEIEKLCVDAHHEAQLAITSTILKNTANFWQSHGNLSDMEKKRHEAEKKELMLRDLRRAKGRFLEWLKHVPADEDLRRLCEDQLEGTCLWINQDDLISPWLRIDNEKPSLLWISGGPGTGKTVLAAHIIRELQTCRPTAYFFCKTDDERKRTTVAVMQNWIWQLTHDSPLLPESITVPSDEHQSPSTSVLQRILLSLQQHLRRSYLIVDGLDECVDDVTEFLRCCQTLSQEWNVLVISRDESAIRKALKGDKIGHKVLTTQDNQMDINSFMVHKAISIQDTEEDINKFVSQKTEQLALSKSWKAMQQGIAHVLSVHAEGMFLWVRLVLDFLLEDATLEDDVGDALKHVPSDLNGFYDKILEKMKSHPSRWKIARRALHWIIHAFRPFTVNELHAAIAFEINSSKPIASFEDILRGSCGLLIRIDETSKKVAIIHATVKEYLLRATDTLIASPGTADSAHAQIGTTCLKYLFAKLRDSVRVDDDIGQSEQRFRKRFSSFPYQLLEYSVIHWCQHIHNSLEQSSQWQSALHDLFSSEDIVVNWLQLFQYLHTNSRSGTLETAQILHNALHSRQPEVTFGAIFEHKRLSMFRSHLGLGDGNRWVRWDLFLRGAGVSQTCLPIILIAAHFNFVDTIKREIRRKVDIETRTRRGGTTLLWAARGGSYDAVRYLLNQKADVNYQSLADQETALAAATYLENRLVNYPGTYPILQILLEAGADLGPRNGSQSLLNVLINSENADSYGEISVVKTLLQHSPDLWKPDHKICGSILHHAVRRNKPRIADAVLESIHAQDPENSFQLLRRSYQGDTALHLALQKSSDLVPVLLGWGAEVDVPDAKEVLPIQYAAQYNLGAAARALIERGCDVETKGHWDKPPLAIALENQSMEVVSILLDSGADTRVIPESLILLPRGVKLDDRLLTLKPTNTPWPLCDRDIYQICFHFKETYLIPIPLTAQILDLAEIWVQSSVMKDDHQVYNESSIRRTYLQSAPIMGRKGRTVEKVNFTITSHDQGWDSNPKFEGTWTWFEAEQLTDRISARVPWPLVHNRHANREWHTHCVTWSRADGLRDLDIFKPGDCIAVNAYARFRGWENFVCQMRIDVFTSLLRRRYTRDEISEIWDPTQKAHRHINERLGHASATPFIPQDLTLRYRGAGSSSLKILAADYGTQDVTTVLKEMVADSQFADDQRLELDTNILDEHFSDPWLGVLKSLSFLYQYGEDVLYLCITAQGRGTVLIEPDHVSGWETTSVQTPLSARERILAIVYGDKELTDPALYEEIYAAIHQKRDFLVSNETLGGDPRFGLYKSCVVFLRRSNGTITHSSAKEHEHLKFAKEGGTLFA